MYECQGQMQILQAKVENKLFEYFEMTYEEAMEQYPDGQYPGMETLDQLYDRAAQGLKWLEANYSDQTVLVTSHGAFIKAALGIASAGKIAYFDKDIWIDNGDCCILEMHNYLLFQVFLGILFLVN